MDLHAGSEVTYIAVIAEDPERVRQLADPGERGRLRIGKDFLHACSIGRSSHVFGLFARFT